MEISAGMSFQRSLPVHITRSASCAHDQKAHGLHVCIEWALLIGMATCSGQQKALFVMLVDRVPRFEAY